ncbi:hypothetical protein H8959_003753 [Pygathrix nigripes]
MRVMAEKKDGADRSGSTATLEVDFVGTESSFLHKLQIRWKKNEFECRWLCNDSACERLSGCIYSPWDFDYKCIHGKGPTEQLVSTEPKVHDIERPEEDDQFTILACDGIWDVVRNEELCDFVRSGLEVSDDPEKVCSEVVDTCLYKGR